MCIRDRINRGEISKIFGELFFAVDPGYRGVAGEVSTQYANLHADSNEKFYIPDNVYIIGTMTVSYTHLDVYKRQEICFRKSGFCWERRLPWRPASPAQLITERFFGKPAK